MQAASSQYFLTTGVSTQVGLTARDDRTRTASHSGRWSLNGGAFGLSNRRACSTVCTNVLQYR